MPPRALILGTLVGQAEAIDWLKEHGWDVFACGRRREGPGVDAADRFFLTDIVDADAVAELARELEVDVVYSVGSDIAMPTVAHVSEKLGLRQFHNVATTQILHRKQELRRFLGAHDLSPVVHDIVRSTADVEAFDWFPAVVKPTDSQAQRGIARVGSASDAVAALPAALHASPTGTAIIEEWLEGPEISIHVMVVDGEVRFYLPSDRLTWDGPILGVAQAHRLPSRSLTSDWAPAVRRLVDDFVEALGVRTGPLYFQLMLTDAGPRIIEVASRLDGCHLWRLIEHHTGFDLLGACMGLLAGDAWTDPEPWSDEPAHELRLLLSEPSHPFRRSEHEALPGERRIFEQFYLDEGELPRATNGVIERVGYCIVRENA